MKPPRIAFAGGGTGGHVAPALALAELLVDRFGPGCVHFLCSGNELERSMLGNAGHDFTALPVARPRGTIRSKATTVITTAMAVPAARRALKAFGADALVCVGGYASLPGALAASLMRLPIVALEANAVPGKVTRAVSRLAGICFAHMPLTRTLDCHVEVAGNPVRRAFLQATNKHDARRALGLNPRLPTLLVMGGSQGATAINDAAIAAAPELAAWQERMNLLHLTGPQDVERAQFAWQASGLNFRVASFTHNTATWMAASDLALTRSGAGTISELLVSGVPLLMVPFPAAADDHQRANAHYVAATGAGVVVPQETLTPHRLCELVDRLMLNEPARAAGREAALSTARPDAAARIIAGVLARIGYSPDLPTADATERAAA
ncbi:MAG: glycosyltransferase [Planctomycetes bacterium]|nr:glycosyltransferase [Planctomycetota bacterium]